MTGIENLFIYWLGTHNLGTGWHFQEIYQLEKPPGCILPGHLDTVYFFFVWETKIDSFFQNQQFCIKTEYFKCIVMHVLEDYFSI